MENLELHYEEQRQILLETKSAIVELKPILEQLAKDYVAPSNEVVVSGEVQVNTQKEVAVTNIEDFVAGLDVLADKLTTAIEINKPEAVTSLVVENIKDAKADKVAVTNLKELRDEIKLFSEDITNAVKGIELNVTTQKTELPTDPKKAIAVRLSDGARFYKALDKMMTAGSGFDGIQQNNLVPYRYDSVYLSGYDGNGNPSTAVYKLAGRTVATLTISYSGTNIISVVRT